MVDKKTGAGGRRRAALAAKAFGATIATLAAMVAIWWVGFVSGCGLEPDVYAGTICEGDVRPAVLGTTVLGAAAAVIGAGVAWAVRGRGCEAFVTTGGVAIGLTVLVAFAYNA